MNQICIKGTEYLYFEKIIGSLDRACQLRLLDLARKMAGEEIGNKNQKIQIIPDDVYEELQKNPNNKFITKTMIRRAYETVREETKLNR